MQIADSGPEFETSSGEARVIVERPAPGLARGHFAWPAWAIATVGALVVVLALAYIARNVKNRRRGR